MFYGGGRQNFLPNTSADPAYGHGKRLDGRNLISAWQSLKGKSGRRQRRYVYRNDQFHQLRPDSTDSVLGQYRWRG